MNKKFLLALFYFLLVNSSAGLAGDLSAAIQKDFDKYGTEKMMEMIVEYVNTALPTRIDTVTTQHKSVYLHGVLNNYYVLDNSEFDRLSKHKEEAQSTLYKITKNYACTTPAMRTVMENGVKIQYHYNFANGVYLTRNLFEIADCEK